MSDEKTEKPTQLSFDDLKTAKSGWEWVQRPMEGGHTQIIGSKRPPDTKKA